MCMIYSYIYIYILYIIFYIYSFLGIFLIIGMNYCITDIDSLVDPENPYGAATELWLQTVGPKLTVFFQIVTLVAIECSNCANLTSASRMVSFFNPVAQLNLTYSSNRYHNSYIYFFALIFNLFLNLFFLLIFRIGVFSCSWRCSAIVYMVVSHGSTGRGARPKCLDRSGPFIHSW
jgi:hypothetical protein